MDGQWFPRQRVQFEGRGVPVGLSFPLVEGTATYAGPEQLTHSVTLPSGIVAGERLIVGISSTGDPNLASTPTDWTVRFNQSTGSGGADRRLIVLEKVAAGSDTLSVTMTSTPSSEAIAAASYRISGAVAVEVSTGATGSSTGPNPASLTPTWGTRKVLWLPFMAARATTVSGFPTNYTNGIELGSSFAANIRVATARRSLEASSEDPGAFTIGASDNWVAVTVGVRGI